MQRAVPAFIAALVLTVLAVAGVQGWQMYQTSQSNKAAQAYQTAMDTGATGDEVKAFTQFDGLAKHGGPYQALALMQQGGIRVDQDKPAEAAALFDQAAAATKNPMIADMATLKAAYVVMDTASLTSLESKLTPLTAAGRPYRVQAREALALARMANGQSAKAKQDLVAIANQLDTPDSARQRAQAIIALIDSGTGGDIKALAEAAKTAQPLPLPGQQGPQAPGGAPIQVQPEPAQ
jgi:hypothetical protein